MSNTELVQSYRQQIGNVVNQANLQLFWNMYNRYWRWGWVGVELSSAAPGHTVLTLLGSPPYNNHRRPAGDMLSPVCG